MVSKQHGLVLIGKAIGKVVGFKATAHAFSPSKVKTDSWRGKNLRYYSAPSELYLYSLAFNLSL